MREEDQSWHNTDEWIFLIVLGTVGNATPTTTATPWWTPLNSMRLQLTLNLMRRIGVSIAVIKPLTSVVAHEAPCKWLVIEAHREFAFSLSLLSPSSLSFQLYGFLKLWGYPQPMGGPLLPIIASRLIHNSGKDLYVFVLGPWCLPLTLTKDICRCYADISWFSWHDHGGGVVCRYGPVQV